MAKGFGGDEAGQLVFGAGVAERVCEDGGAGEVAVGDDQLERERSERLAADVMDNVREEDLYRAVDILADGHLG